MLKIFFNFVQVFPYGSVPLKTYLPDGDIDLTAFGGANFEDALASDMVSVLEGEDKNRAAEFIVKDVQLIRAEVFLFNPVMFQTLFVPFTHQECPCMLLSLSLLFCRCVGWAATVCSLKVKGNPR